MAALRPKRRAGGSHAAPRPRWPRSVQNGERASRTLPTAAKMAALLPKRRAGVSHAAPRGQDGRAPSQTESGRLARYPPRPRWPRSFPNGERASRPLPTAAKMAALRPKRRAGVSHAALRGQDSRAPSQTESGRLARYPPRPRWPRSFPNGERASRPLPSAAKIAALRPKRRAGVSHAALRGQDSRAPSQTESGRLARCTPRPRWPRSFPNGERASRTLHPAAKMAALRPKRRAGVSHAAPRGQDGRAPSQTESGRLARYPPRPRWPRSVPNGERASRPLPSAAKIAALLPKRRAGVSPAAPRGQDGRAPSQTESGRLARCTPRPRWPRSFQNGLMSTSMAFFDSGWHTPSAQATSPSTRAGSVT